MIANYRKKLLKRSPHSTKPQLLSFLPSRKQEAPKVAFRSIEQCKQRYFSVSAAILAHRGFSEHILVKQPFEMAKEKERKQNAQKLLLRTREDNELEKNLLSDLKKLD